MPYEVATHEQFSGTSKPFIVTVNGFTLVDKLNRPRRFADSISAALAGAKRVDILKARVTSESNGEPK